MEPKTTSEEGREGVLCREGGGRYRRGVMNDDGARRRSTRISLRARRRTIRALSSRSRSNCQMQFDSDNRVANTRWDKPGCEAFGGKGAASKAG
ncbi:hypothetical protein DIE03_06125 [Burkholderia sp. Bp8992]|nr:hypothetical protein DIE03_06125 [Burkholderia sp. Bp8992]